MIKSIRTLIVPLLFVAAAFLLQPARAQTQAILADYLLTLDAPAFIRAGDSDTIKLTLAPDARSSAEDGSFSDVYDSYNVIVESQLEMAGAEIQPMGIVSEPLAPGGQTAFFWRIKPLGAEKISGTVRSYLRFVPLQGGAEIRRLISVQTFDVQPAALIGLNGSASRWLGLIGLSLSVVLGFPFIEPALKRFGKRQK
jgi:hypothetical protein